MNYLGIITGVFTLFAIGLGFVYVIKLEYYVGACVKKIVLILGILLMLSTILYSNFIISSAVGIFSGSIIWGVTEMDEQEERANKKHPKHPNKICDKLKKSFLISK